ncbi:hypothetical protein NE237_015876 [Protea cynaroides]|uniref:Uncharacterized protein n=1 Tax=Protea cynaroides TaxID=273540 RepID=A0A9Q0QRC7_9MAGN|nr:hypothetical protein NE237_015876 [Protea cynaroides]
MPDFSGLPNLEELILQCCRSLVEVHESISHLSKLVVLDLRCCRKLKHLPSGIDCMSLQSLPLLPSSLNTLKASGCSSLERLPNLSNLEHLRILELSLCQKLNEIEGLESLESAEIIKLDGCYNLESFSDRMLKVIIDLQNHNICDIYLPWKEYDGLAIKNSISASWEATHQILLNMETQEMIICIYCLSFTFFHSPTKTTCHCVVNSWETLLNLSRAWELADTSACSIVSKLPSLEASLTDNAKSAFGKRLLSAGRRFKSMGQYGQGELQGIAKAMMKTGRLLSATPLTTTTDEQP